MIASSVLGSRFRVRLRLGLIRLELRQDRRSPVSIPVLLPFSEVSVKDLWLNCLGVFVTGRDPNRLMNSRRYAF